MYEDIASYDNKIKSCYNDKIEKSTIFKSYVALGFKRRTILTVLSSEQVQILMKLGKNLIAISKT